jgi:hypothetical protein
MPDKPLAQWRIDLRTRLKAKGYDLDDIYKTRDRLCTPVVVPFDLEG